MSAGHTSAVLGRRTCALLAVVSAVLHGLMIGHVEAGAAVVLVVAMMGACLYCARDLWVVGSLRAWLLVAIMNLGMVALHMSGSGHHHGAEVSIAGATAPSTLMAVATAISLIEVTAAAAVLLYRTRDGAARLTAGRGELAQHQ